MRPLDQIGVSQEVGGCTQASWRFYEEVIWTMKSLCGHILQMLCGQIIILFFDHTLIVFVVQIQMNFFYSQPVCFLAKRESGPTFLLIRKICGRLPPALHKRTVFQHLLNQVVVSNADTPLSGELLLFAFDVSSNCFQYLKH